MTAQFSECLVYQGKTLRMQSLPLSSYLDSLSIPPAFAEVHTACWRRYVGTWEVIHDRLYLTDIKAHWQDGAPVRLEQLFPEFTDSVKRKIFAHWYTGTLICAQGKLLRYAHMGYESTYEESLLLSFDCGTLVNTNLRQHATPS